MNLGHVIAIWYTGLRVDKTFNSENSKSSSKLATKQSKTKQKQKQPKKCPYQLPGDYIISFSLNENIGNI